MKTSWQQALLEEISQKRKQKEPGSITADSIIDHLRESISREIEESNKKLHETLDAAQDTEKKKKLAANEEAMLRKQLQDKFDEINAWLEKKRKEAEEERKKLEEILLRLFASLRESKIVTSDELAPGIFVHAVHAKIFEAQEKITRDYFNCLIDEPEFNKQKRQVVHDYVNDAINKIINNKPASQHEFLRQCQRERMDAMVSRFNELTELERVANAEYSKAVTSRVVINHAQGYKNIGQINRDTSQLIMNKDKKVVEAKETVVEIKKTEVHHEIEERQTAKTETTQEKISAPAPVEKVKESSNKQETDEAKNISKTESPSIKTQGTSPVSTRKKLPTKNRNTFSSEPATPSASDSEAGEHPTPKMR